MQPIDEGRHEENYLQLLTWKELAAAAVANVAGGLLARVAGQLEPVGHPPKGH